MLIKYKWIMLLLMTMIAFAAVSLLQGAGRSAGRADLSDPFLDPYALSLAHRHAGHGMESASEKAVQLQIEWTGGPPQAGVHSDLSLTITNGQGELLKDFVITNEKLMHLIVVSEDLQYFQHIHPEYTGQGHFKVNVSFPTGGTYKLYADFLPTGMNELTRSVSVQVQGKLNQPVPLEESDSLTAHVHGMKVQLEFADKPAPGSATSMTYTFTDGKTGEPVEDLELYLGAVGHVVAIDEALQQFIHVHPLNWASSGPQAVFGVSFPVSGTYKLWGQFRRGGVDMIIPFIVTV
ncbi:hypothetical protein ACFO9Q_20825 [Paenibacillus sp. GCM10023252]|uniref:hypothetical protein n=1 Tax=Paenibacillus sp. GCM10023252 TaxID=3252649 RepID=UPI0036119CDC